MTDPAADRRLALFGARVEAIADIARARGSRGALLRTRRNFAWLSVGGLNHVVNASEIGASPVLVTLDGTAAVLAPVNEAARIVDEEVRGPPLEVVSLPWHDPGAIDREAIRRCGGPPLGDEELEDELLAIRSVLSPMEHDRIAWLGGEVDVALAETAAGVRVGDTEERVTAHLAARLAERGMRTPVLLAAADERIERYRHPLPGPTAVRRRLMLVVVAERWGLHSAATRFVELEPPDEALRARIAAVGDVAAAMRDATRPGASFGEVLDAARGRYRELGFADEWQLHHQGGSIGYRGRERIAVPGDPTPARPGMAFAWNPSITGAKAEEMVLLLP
jgi:Xaa-Pro dipeptidase